MKKKFDVSQQPEAVVFSGQTIGVKQAKKPKRKYIAAPTGDKRHMPHIRFGRISFEIFAKDPQRRRELGLPVYHYEED